MQVTRPVVVVCVFTMNNKVCKHLISETVPNYIALNIIILCIVNCCRYCMWRIKVGFIFAFNSGSENVPSSLLNLFYCIWYRQHILSFVVSRDSVLSLISFKLGLIKAMLSVSVVSVSLTK